MNRRRGREALAVALHRGVPVVDFGPEWDDARELIAASTDWGDKPRPTGGVFDFSDAEAWGVPDWRDGRAYRSKAEWKWEFLRRNPLYRRSWVARDALDFGDFGLRSWADPRDPDAVLDELSRFRICDPGRLPDAIGGDQVAVIFDLNAPLKAQLAEVMRKLKKPTRKRDDKYVNYLRVIDAMDANATAAAICRELYKVEDPEDVRKRVAHERAAAIECLWLVSGLGRFIPKTRDLEQ